MFQESLDNANSTLIKKLTHITELQGYVALVMKSVPKKNGASIEIHRSYC